MAIMKFDEHISFQGSKDVGNKTWYDIRARFMKLKCSILLNNNFKTKYK